MERREEREEETRREVEVWNGSVVAVPRLRSHVCLRFRVDRVRVLAFARVSFAPSCSLPCSLRVDLSLVASFVGSAGTSLLSHESAA